MRKNNMRKRTAALAAAFAMTASLIGTNGSVRPLTCSQGAPIIAAAAQSSVVFTKSAGYGEGGYAEWSPVANAAGYNVYCDGAKLDSMLIRQYKGYFRADAVGLKAGGHTIKVVPVINGAEDASKASETVITSSSLDRTGFAFSGQNGACGAYNADGTLKANALVIYITESTKDSVSVKVATNSKGGQTEVQGLQNIIYAFKKGYDSRPVVFRFIGTVTDPSVTDKGDITIDGGSKYKAGMTIEGIGEDAAARGYGFRVKNISNLEIRNMGFMLVDSSEGDNVSLQQGNDHVWVHNCDFFYGEAGGDADQAKGDGALDCKKSTYITFSYNHFFDSGKCNLLGLSEGTTEGLYITYHHNWYDHSDSRHPRVRYYSAHVYNNYYDGNSKYGMGSTLGSSVFSENNYFRNCKYPMLISMQGSDVAEGGGTFSGEDGGVIKSFGNYMTGQKAFVPYSQNNTAFDAYDASSKTEKVPSSVKSKQGGNTYNNFDTGSQMYSYTADSAADVPAKVTANAGRLGGGDLKFTFTAEDDVSYSVNSSLMSALRNYTSPVVAIGSGFKEDSGNVPPQPVTQPTTQAPTQAVSTQPASQPTTYETPVTGADVIYASPDGGGNGSSISSPTDALSALKMLRAGGTVYLLEGTYNFSDTILLDRSSSGSAGKYKTVSAYPGASVIWDFSGQGAADPSKRGITLDSDYWCFKGFEITKAADNGMLLAGSNNRIEMMVFSDNQDTGLQISRYRSDASTIDQWPSNNLVLNCSAMNNCDNATMENADGFAAKLTCGNGNVFDGCMAYNNSDDGWDLFAKTATGPIGIVTLRNCIAFRNGFTEFGEGYGDCDGNGFKLGGSGVGSAHVVENCLAFENLNCGFTDNNNPLLGSLKDCTAYNNGVGGNGKPNVSCYRCTGTTTLFTNVLSYLNTGKVSSLGAAGIKLSNDKLVGKAVNTLYYNSAYYLAESENMTNGAKLGDKVAPKDSDFISLSVPAMGTNFHKAWRNADGTLNPSGFAETASDSSFADIGYHMSNGTSQTPPTTQQPTQPVENVVYGDADADGSVTINDVVAILCYTANPSRNPLKGGGADNADVYQRGDGVNALDATSVQKRLASIIEELPESYLS